MKGKLLEQLGKYKKLREKKAEVEELEKKIQAGGKMMTDKLDDIKLDEVKTIAEKAAVTAKEAAVAIEAQKKKIASMDEGLEKETAKANLVASQLQADEQEKRSKKLE